MHFIAECGALYSVRQRCNSEIENELLYRNQSVMVEAVINDKDVLMQLVLDCTSVTVTGKVSISTQESIAIERITRMLCFALHPESCELLDQPV